jgi:diguanylate cyclase (GGDEF)-like protein
MREMSAPFIGARLPHPTSLVLIDVDSLSIINRQHGRLVGDDVLSRVASAARKNLRTTDVLLRHRSDEFVALLPHTDSSTAQLLGARITDAVREEQLSANLHFAVTVIAATLPEDGACMDDLIQAASTRLRRMHVALPTARTDCPPESIH